MMPMLALSARSAWHRRLVLALVAASIALSSFLLLTLERVRTDLRDGFAQSVSGTDLIVGPRGGALQLLLHSVFHVGAPTNTLQWKSAQAVGAHPSVAWWVPLAFGDTVRGFPVVGTTAAFFQRFRHGDRQPLALAAGRWFGAEHDAVVGADVAQRLGLVAGSPLTLSHGDGAIAGNDHDEDPFTVVGVMRRTGTPVDRSVYIPLEGLHELHRHDPTGLALPSLSAQHDSAAAAAPTLNAMFVGLHQRTAVFALQRDVAAYRGEPLMAVLPGVALDELWQVVGAGEQALQAASVLVAAVSLAGLMAVILAGLEPRRRELAILRAVGARPAQIVALVLGEGLLLTLVAAAAGLLLHFAAVAALAQPLRLHTGLALTPGLPDARGWWLLGAIVAGGAAASLWPALRACRLSLADGLMPRT
jgi:putative ABC transport system permease protein